MSGGRRIAKFIGHRRRCTGCPLFVKLTPARLFCEASPGRDTHILIDPAFMVATAPSAPCSSAADIRSLDQLREFVHLTLCQRENLLEFHFPMPEVELMKNGVRCGIQFVLYGPRQVKLAAVWASDRNEILMYAANGRRFRRIRLQNPVA